MNKNKKIIYPLTASSWNNKEIIALHRLIDGSNFSMGLNVKKFEKNFAKFHKVKYSVMVNSGSSANLLMVASLFYQKNKHKIIIKKESSSFFGMANIELHQDLLSM